MLTYFSVVCFFTLLPLSTAITCVQKTLIKTGDGWYDVSNPITMNGFISNEEYNKEDIEHLKSLQHDSPFCEDDWCLSVEDKLTKNPTGHIGYMYSFCKHNQGGLNFGCYADGECTDTILTRMDTNMHGCCCNTELCNDDFRGIKEARYNQANIKLEQKNKQTDNNSTVNSIVYSDVIVDHYGGYQADNISQKDDVAEKLAKKLGGTAKVSAIASAIAMFVNMIM